MAINFPDNPSDGDIATVGGVTYTYTASSNTWKPPVPGASASTLTDLSISDGTAGQLLTTDGNNNFSFTSIASASSTEIFADMAALIAKTGMSAGDQGLVLENNKLFMYTGSAWYLIATMVNNSPTAITNVDSGYILAADGTPTVITAVSTDPEGFPLTWSYAITSGSLGSTATISQTDNVFTITPSTNSADSGTFTLTISATDGGSSGIVNKVTSISLAFSVINSKYTTLLATATEISDNNNDNNNIIDSSTNNHSVSVNGDVCAGTFSPYRSGGYSTYFGGVNDFLSIADDDAIEFGSGDFTLEMWYKGTDTDQYATLTAKGTGGFTSGDWSLMMNAAVAGDIALYVYDYSVSAPMLITGDVSASDNAWVHIAVVRSGNDWNLYVNGVSEAYVDSSITISDTSSLVLIGADHSYGRHLSGFISDYRIVKGTAVYTATFTPPIERLEAITNTSLLTCHLPYISDGSINNHTITSNGNVTTQPFSPYDYLEYNPNVHGGSVYFDGNGDYVSIPSSNTKIITTNNDDFTIEAWVYPTSFTGGLQTIICQWGQDGLTKDGFILSTDTSGVVSWYYGPFDTSYSLMTSTPSTLKLNAWSHVAIVRSSTPTTNHTMYINGIQVQSVNNSNTTGTFDMATYIGYYGRGLGASSTSWWNGYISDVKFVKGTALYTSDFTPPTAPLSSSGSSLHIKGTDASIIDKSQSSNLKVFGNTTGSTTQVKFTDTKSMYFDGSGDYIKTSASTDYDLPTDFTIEAWIHPTALSSNRLIVDTYNPSNAGSYQLYWRGTGNSLAFYSQGDGVVLQDPSSSSILVNTWNHVAVSRSGTSAKLFVNGIVVDTATNSRDFTHGIPVAIGYQQVSGTNYFAGYIQDVRITKGLARYTANFTPHIESLKG
ncbi:LamG domain-containing protein [bacterium]|jgi:hypothetical protein|nr:LamG domain-containing protein [bacterium]